MAAEEVAPITNFSLEDIEQRKEQEVQCACGTNVRRVAMEEHANTCAKAIVECPFFLCGCPFKGSKQHLDEHVAKNNTEHLNMLLKRVESLSSELYLKNKQIAALQRDVASKANGSSYGGGSSYDKAPRSSGGSSSYGGGGDTSGLSKEERVIRTVHIGNVSAQITQEQLLSFFSLCGPIAQIRLAGDDNHHARFAFIEFYTIEGAAAAIGLSGTMLYDRPIKVDYAKAPIAKGQATGGYPGGMMPPATAGYRYHPYM